MPKAEMFKIYTMVMTNSPFVSMSKCLRGGGGGEGVEKMDRNKEIKVFDEFSLRFLRHQE